MTVSHGRKRYAELEKLDDILRELRKQLKNGDDVASVGRSAALLYVGLIERISALEQQLDIALNHILFSNRLSFNENARRASIALHLFSKLTTMQVEAIDGMIACLGGYQAIAIQLIVDYCMRGDATGFTTVVRAELIERLATIVTARRRKRRARRESARRTQRREDVRVLVDCSDSRHSAL